MSTFPLRTALLTNFIPPQRVGQYEALAKEVGELRVFSCVEMEDARAWATPKTSLDVVLQKVFTLQSQWKHPDGSCGPIYAYIPYDTFSVLAAWRPTVVLAGEMGLRCAFAMLYSRLWAHCPCVIWADVSESSEKGRGRLRVALRKALLRYADAVFVNGASGRRYLESLSSGLPPIYSIPVPVPRTDLFELRPDFQSVKPLRILILGRLEPLKGIMAFLPVLKDYLDRSGHECQVTIVGRGPVETAIREFNPGSRMTVSLHAELPYEAISTVLAEAQVLAMPSFAETWGLVIAEALSAGLPVLASMACQSGEELITPGENGWLFEWGSAESLDRALDSVFSATPETLASMSQAARDAAHQILPENLAVTMTKYLSEVVERHRSGGVSR